MTSYEQAKSDVKGCVFAVVGLVVALVVIALVCAITSGGAIP